MVRLRSTLREQPLPAVDPSLFDAARVIQTPEDIVALRAADPTAALEWRMRVREQFLDAFDNQLSVVGLNREGSYVLAKENAR